MLTVIWPCWQHVFDQLYLPGGKKRRRRLGFVRMCGNVYTGGCASLVNPHLPTEVKNVDVDCHSLTCP